MKQAREEDIAGRVEQIQRVRGERQKDAKEQRRRKQQKEAEEHAFKIKIRQEAQVHPAALSCAARCAVALSCAARCAVALSCAARCAVALSCAARCAVALSCAARCALRSSIQVYMYILEALRCWYQEECPGGTFIFLLRQVAVNVNPNCSLRYACINYLPLSGVKTMCSYCQGNETLILLHVLIYVAAATRGD
jgi:hypothetical protein